MEAAYCFLKDNMYLEVEDDLACFLHETMADLRVSIEARRLAEKLYNQWQAGLVPNRAHIRTLRKLLIVVVGCGRLQRDGSCAWLRKHAREEDLLPPDPGQRLLCHRRASGTVSSTYEACIGYRRPGREGQE